MKIAHLSDLHLCTSLGEGKADLLEQESTIRGIINDIKGAVDLVVIPGDIYDGPPTEKVRECLAGIVNDFSKWAPVVICYGNHDPDRSLSWLGYIPNVHVIYGGLTIAPKQGLFVHCLSWPQKRYLATQTERNNLGLDTAASQALGNILNGFQTFIADRPKDKHVFIGHLDVGGAKLDNDQPIESAVDMPVSLGSLTDLRADYVALGHIHKHQKLADDVYYSGSPYPTTFGSEGDKGYIIADLDTHEVEFRKSKYRELITVEAIGDASGYGVEQGKYGVDPCLIGKVVRLRRDYPPTETKETMAWLSSLRNDLISEDGAAEVIIDARPIKVERETRAPEIAGAKTDEERLKVYWGATEKPSDPDAIVEKLETIKSEIA